MQLPRPILPLACLVALVPAAANAGARPGRRPASQLPVTRAAFQDLSPADWMLPAAEASMPGRVQALNTEHYRFYIREAAREEAGRIVEQLEALWRFYQETLASLVPLENPRGKVTVFFFSGPEELDHFVELVPAPPDGRRGGVLWNRSPAFIAFDASAILGSSDLGVLFHAVVRAGHQVLLYEPGVEGSWWLREGLAVYFMQTLIDREGRFRVGQIRTSEEYIRDITPRGRLAAGIFWAQKPRKALKAARKSYRKRHHLPIRDLLDLTADHSWSDAAARDTASVEAWILVHFLLHGKEGALRPRPASFLSRERRGEGGAEAFRRTVSGDLERFESFLYGHVSRMI